MALVLGIAGALLNALAASVWQHFKFGHAQLDLDDEEAGLVLSLTLMGWGLIILGAICGAIGIAVQPS
jgi:hypothetical protein